MATNVVVLFVLGVLGIIGFLVCQGFVVSQLLMALSDDKGHSNSAVFRVSQHRQLRGSRRLQVVAHNQKYVYETRRLFRSRRQSQQVRSS